MSLLKPPGIGMSCFTMTFGAISNLTALGILARVRLHRQSKAPFLLLTVALLVADLGGHVILGALALYRHMDWKNETHFGEPTKEFCQIFGASMVFFGLCPLLLGFAMAAERCVAITQPFFHSAMITLAHAWQVVLFVSCLALVLAVLPLSGVGTYTVQYPGTWCFLRIHDPQSTGDYSLVLAFSCLGLTALIFSQLCNIVSIVALLQARRKSYDVNPKSTSFRTRHMSSASSSSIFLSLDVEMLVQLAVITVVSCVCWIPFLIHILVLQLKESPESPEQSKDGFTLLSLRMASWNQILDPWVYILLRKTVLFRIYSAFHTQRPTETLYSSSPDSRRRTLSLH
ncbi:prostaglandin E receptor 1c (subtype EP1) [Acanthopagrus schlegelii]